MTTSVKLGEAERVEGRSDSRSIKFRWKVRDTETGAVFADLTIAHKKAGANYFTGEVTNKDLFNVSLSNVELEDQGVFSVTRFQLFKGIGLFRYEAGKRFSRKKLNEAADRALAEFTELYESGNEKVLAYFAEDAEA